MIKYSKGRIKVLITIKRKAFFKLKCFIGFLIGYKVYRPDIDHSVYEIDNKKLLSTFKSFAKIYHAVSYPENFPLHQYQIIEIEHPFALVGHVDHQTDYEVFRRNYFNGLKAFFSNFNPDRHRLIATSEGTVSYLNTYLRKVNLSIPEKSIHQIYWGLKKRRNIIRRVKKLSVFHSGGIYPYSKGTRDAIDLARKFPSVHFRISVDLNSSLVKNNLLSNIEYLDVWSKDAYVNGMMKSNIFLMPLYGDGWGAPLEALSNAIPIIGYNSYDKKELIEDNVNGFLVKIPPELSFYDFFLKGPYMNWDGYNQYLADYINDRQVEDLSLMLDKYCTQPDLIIEHSIGASRLFDEKFSSQVRLQKIKRVYGDLRKENNL